MKIVSKAILANAFMRTTWKKTMYFRKKGDQNPPKNSIKMLVETEISS